MNLPRPSAFASSSEIHALPRAGPSSRPPESPSLSRCYRFGLTTRPDTTEGSQDTELQQILQKLFDASQLLAIPSPFGRGDGQAWTHSEQHYPTLLQWKQQHVPALLSHIGKLLEQLSTISDAEDAGKDTSGPVDLVLGHVVCAVARYLSPEPVGLVPSSKSCRDNFDVPQDDGWTDERTQTRARSALNELFHSARTWNEPTAPSLAKALLTDYIKPIFTEVASSSSASQSSIDPATGRKKAPAPGSAFISHLDANLGQHRFQSAAEDNDASDFVPKRFAFSLSADSLRSTIAGSETSLPVEALQSLAERNEALGCINVLAWCLDNLQLTTESDWSSVWPLLVPPLLTLLEHPQPRFRLRGSMLVHKLLIRPSDGEDAHGQDARMREVVLGKILTRTGIGSLLERALHANLTYIHDKQYAAGLLWQSIGALRQLILLTTYPIAWRDPLQPLFEHPSNANGANAGWAGTALDYADDCGKRRMEALFRLVSEAILSTWSYLPLPPSSTRLGRELVNVTCSAYFVLANDLAAPVLNDTADTSSLSAEQGAKKESVGLGGMARFLDVTLDWIFRSWISNVAFDHTDQITTSLRVLEVASRLLFPSQSGVTSAENATKQNVLDNEPDVHPSSLPSFTSLILLSVAKCYISALESPLRSSTTRTEASADARWKQLEHRLTRLMVTLSIVDSTVEPRWAEMVKVDQRLSALLPSQ